MCMYIVSSCKLSVEIQFKFLILVFTCPHLFNLIEVVYHIWINIGWKITCVYRQFWAIKYHIWEWKVWHPSFPQKPWHKHTCDIARSKQNEQLYSHGLNFHINTVSNGLDLQLKQLKDLSHKFQLANSQIRTGKGSNCGQNIVLEVQTFFSERF